VGATMLGMPRYATSTHREWRSDGLWEVTTTTRSDPSQNDLQQAGNLQQQAMANLREAQVSLRQAVAARQGTLTGYFLASDYQLWFGDKHQALLLLQEALEKYPHEIAAYAGKWAWFTGGTVIFHPDGTMVYANANDGTWQCTDGTQGRFVLRWRVGGYINSLALTTDGRHLSSTDQSQWYVKADRIGAISDTAGEVPDATAFFNKGKNLSEKGNLAEAIAEFTKALAKNPHLAEAYARRGFSYLSTGRYDQALADFTKVLAKNPEDVEAYINRGSTYLAKGLFDQAITDFDAAVKIKPTDGSAYYNRGTAYNDKGLYQQATADFTKAIKIMPMFSSAYYNRGIAYFKNGEYDKALDDVNKAQDLGYAVKSELLEKLRKAVQEGRP
jgi:tetratricopeptide (TPR) repeat protein